MKLEEHHFKGSLDKSWVEVICRRLNNRGENVYDGRVVGREFSNSLHVTGDMVERCRLAAIEYTLRKPGNSATVGMYDSQKADENDRNAPILGEFAHLGLRKETGRRGDYNFDPLTQEETDRLEAMVLEEIAKRPVEVKQETKSKVKMSRQEKRTLKHKNKRGKK